MKKFKKVFALTLAMVLVLGLFSGCGPKKAAGLYENGRLVKPWDDLLKEIGYTDFDGKEIKCKTRELDEEGITIYTSYFIPSEQDEKGKKKYDLVILNGVTAIGAGAFDSCTHLKSIALPNSVTSIGEQAFIRCKALESINLPNSIKTIEEYAFSTCWNLKSVKLPNHLTSIEKGMFFYCGDLTTI